MVKPLLVSLQINGMGKLLPALVALVLFLALVEGQVTGQRGLAGEPTLANIALVPATFGLGLHVVVGGFRRRKRRRR